MVCAFGGGPTPICLSAHLGPVPLRNGTKYFETKPIDLTGRLGAFGGDPICFDAALGPAPLRNGTKSFQTKPIGFERADSCYPPWSNAELLGIALESVPATKRSQSRVRSAGGKDVKVKSPGTFLGAGALNLIGRLPTLPHTRACSTIGAEGLNYRVRDGNGWDPLARVTQSRLD